MYFERSHCASVIIDGCFDQGQHPPVTGASGVVPDLISQLLIFIIVSINESNTSGAGLHDDWHQHCARAY